MGRRYISIKNSEVNEKKLPESIYKTVVSSLYADPGILALGVISCIAAAFVIFWKTQDPAQLIFASVFLLVGSLRFGMSKSFQIAKERNLSIEVYEIWERKYNLTNLVFIMALCCWYANGLVRTNDSFVQLLSMCVVLCYLAGITIRNFASKKVIRSQVILASFIMVGSTVLYDHSFGNYSILLGAFIIPIFYGTHKISARLRGMMFRAEINSVNNKTIANRFDLAIDNVAHGIAMFDKQGVIVVANERFKDLVDTQDWEIVGCHVSILDFVKIKGLEHYNLGNQIASCLRNLKSENFQFTLASGLIIEAEYNIANDGGVIVLADVSERIASQEVIQDLANYDTLTHLYNRRHFSDVVEKRLNESRNYCVSSLFFIDLDKFKDINDTLGHAIGDELLCIVASRLKLLLKPDAVIGRFGGDEFVIFCPDMNDQKLCSVFAEQILQELSRPIIIRSHYINIACSIGVSMSPAHGLDMNTLIQRADLALYSSKVKGSSTYTFFTQELGDVANEKRQLETELRQAIKNDEIDLFYQPLFDIKLCKIVGCEALARWHHPKLGLISPAVFIELAEETGLIVQLGENLMRKAMLECRKWPDDIHVAVNVSSIQFRKVDIYKLVSTLLQETGLPAYKLDIEVTESAMINNIEYMIATLQKLSSLGVRISLDDFGTGYSSLSYLQTLPFDKVKIDKSFVDNGIANQRALVLLQGVVDLVKRLGMQVIVEGIETSEQLEVMENNIDVNEYQGFYFFKPMHPDELLNQFEIIQKSVSHQTVVRLSRN